MNTLEINSLVLAYLGDTIYENHVRKYLVKKKIANVKDLQTAAVKYVSAKSQAMFLQSMIEHHFLFPEELDVVKRARNCKINSHPKNCDIMTYKNATGFEALIGYLDLEHRKERINELMNYIFGR